MKAIRSFVLGPGYDPECPSITTHPSTRPASLSMLNCMSYSVQYFRDMLTALIRHKAAGGSEARPFLADAMSAAQHHSGQTVKVGRSKAA